MYRYGADYKPGADEETDNSFTYSQGDKITITAEQKVLDAEEQKFMQDPNPSQNNQQKPQFAPPQQKEPAPHPVNPNSNGTNISSRSVHVTADLGAIQHRSQMTQQPPQPLQPTPQNVPQQPAQPQIQFANTPMPHQVQGVGVVSPQPMQPVIPQNSQPIASQPQTNAVPNHQVQQQTPAPMQQAAPQPVLQQNTNTSSFGQTTGNQPFVQQNQPQPTPNFQNPASGQQPHPQIAQPLAAPQPTQPMPTSPAPQPQQHVAPAPTTVTELNQIIAPKKEDPKEDEFAPKNYIFGSIENAKGEGVKGAAVVIKKNDAMLEVVKANESGDFQSNYEYKAGEYTLYVNIDSKEYNVINVLHEPVDPMPVIIGPKDIPLEELEPLPDPEEEQSDIFDGSYDSKYFDLGTNYKELEVVPAKKVEPDFYDMEQPVSFPVPQTTTAGIAPTFQNELAPQRQTPQFDGLQSYEQALQQAFVSNTPQPTVHKDVSDDDMHWENAVLGNTTLPTSQTTQTNATPTQPTPTAAVLNFEVMQDSSERFEEMYVSIPNTVNGFVSSGSSPIPAALVTIKDAQGNVARTIASDPTGKFYSFAPLPSGRYEIEVARDGYTFPKMFVELKGSSIRPKVINTI
jgi:hypothetical protein